jgi:hypothetical protein
MKGTLSGNLEISLRNRTKAAHKSSYHEQRKHMRFPMPNISGISSNQQIVKDGKQEGAIQSCVLVPGRK